MQHLAIGILVAGYASLILSNPLNAKRDVKIDPKTCDQAKTDIINAEIQYATDIALAAQTSIKPTDQYFIEFYPEVWTSGPLAEYAIDNSKSIFENMGKVLGQATDFTWLLTCDNSKKSCEGNTVASTNPKDGTINLCDAFFDSNIRKATSDILTECTKDGAPACMHLQQFKQARAFTLVHELTHLPFVMKKLLSGLWANDYAYNVDDCLAMKKGGWDRSKASYADPKDPLCKDESGKEGVCDTENCLSNADSIAFIAAGIYFTGSCKAAIPIRPSSNAKYARDGPSCPLLNLLPDITEPDDIPPIEDDAAVLAAIESGKSEESAASTTSAVGVYTNTSSSTSSTTHQNSSTSAMHTNISSITPHQLPSATGMYANTNSSTTHQLTSATGIYTNTSSTTTRKHTSYACSNYEDPDQGISAFCTCTNGATASIAIPTETSTLDDSYVPCPYTVAPDLPTPTSTTMPAGVNTLYPILSTYTDDTGHTYVEECQSLSTQHEIGFPITVCAGDIKTISAPPSGPSVSVKVGLNQVLVGSLSGDPLYTSVSSILEKLCPTPTSGQPLVVPSGALKIHDIVWVDGDQKLQTNGELSISVDSGNYSDPKIREAMIKSAANTFKSSATGSNCWDAPYTDTEPRAEPVPGHQNLCNAANFAGVDYYPSTPFLSTPTNSTNWLYPHMDFEVKAGGFDCEMIIDALDAVLTFIAPEFAAGEAELAPVIQAGCDIASHLS